jgi:DNA mismatch repair protein MSH6
MELGEGVVGYGSHEHHTWTFLHKTRKDKFGRSPDHPDFNPRTITFPAQFLKDQTPAMKQWCEVKADNFDTVLFFKVDRPLSSLSSHSFASVCLDLFDHKVGKFYELFHMDADIGVAEADLIYMKGSKAHSGFPEVSYGKYASLLVSKG